MVDAVRMKNVKYFDAKSNAQIILINFTKF